MTFDDWMKIGLEEGYCGPPVCATHDGVPMSVLEGDEDDVCLHILRLYEDAEVKQAVEDAHSPSIWRNTWTRKE